MLKLFCFHKYGKIENNVQYCLKCGKAKAAPKCKNHEFEIIEELGKYRGSDERLIAINYIQKCKYCGKMQKFTYKQSDL